MTPELQTLLDRINALRSNIWKELEGVDAAGLNWAPLAKDTNSLYVLATHCIGSEHGWVAETIGGEAKTRVRSLEFEARGNSMGELRDRFEATAAETRRIFGRLEEADLDRTIATQNYGTVTVRWAILHLIEHFSEHLGQMRLTKQLWEAKS